MAQAGWTKPIAYTYDMGDDWRRIIVVDDVAPAEPDMIDSRFVAGVRRCPPEDVGGFPGFERLLDAMHDPSHEEHAEMRRWYGGPFDPGDISEQDVTRAMGAIAVRRHAGKIAYQKSRVRH